MCLYSAVRYDICADTPICGCLYTSYQLSAYRSKSTPSGAAFAPVMYFPRAAALAASSSFFVRPDTYLTMLFPLASVPTVIFARYLPSFCFAILLPLLPFCFIIGSERSSFLAPFPLFRTVAAVRNSYDRLDEEGVNLLRCYAELLKISHMTQAQLGHPPKFCRHFITPLFFIY